MKFLIFNFNLLQKLEDFVFDSCEVRLEIFNQRSTFHARTSQFILGSRLEIQACQWPDIGLPRFKSI